MRKSLNLLFIFFSINLYTCENKAFPHRWHNIDTHLILTNISHLKSSRSTTTSEYLHSQRKILSKKNSAINGQDVTSKTDGKIIFPSDNMDIHPQKYIPKPFPSCENFSFCENTLNYPNDFVETALRMNKDLKFFSGVDLVPDIVHRFNAPTEDYPLCESKETVIYPKAAKNQDKEWMFIINQGDFTQSVRVETCGKENSACNLVDGFAEGYKTTCKQKYIYRQLMAISSTGQIQPDIFRFPVSCCCHVKFTGDPLLRIGIGVSKKSEILTSEAQRK